MTNAQKLREIAYKHAEPKVIWNDGNMSIYPDEEKIESLLSDLTALISEHYVSREEYDEEKKSNALLHKAMVTAEKGGHDKAMEEISEHYYPKEFTEWVSGTGWQYHMKFKIWTLGMTADKMVKATTDELYEVWKENER